MNPTRTFLGITASAITGALIALTAVWLLAPETDLEPDDPSDNSSATPPPDAPEPAALPGNQTEVRPNLDMSDVDWTLDGIQTYPFSPTAGPNNWEMSGPASGFAQTPEGATLAALHISSRSGPFLPLETRLKVIDEQMTATPTLDAYRDAMESEGEPGPIDFVPAQTVGYAVHAYTDQAATIEIATTQEDRYFSAILAVEWNPTTEDWNLHPPHSATDWQSEFRMLPNLEGFTPWGP